MGVYGPRLISTFWLDDNFDHMLTYIGLYCVARYIVAASPDGFSRASSSMAPRVVSDECEPVSVLPIAVNSGHAQLTPLGESCGAGQLEIGPAVEMLFLVEMVVYGRMDGDEFLQTSHASETLHRPFSPSKRQV